MALVNAPQQDTTSLLCWNTSGQLSLPTRRLLARPATRIILSAVYAECGVLIGCGRSEDRTGDGVTAEVPIFATHPSVFLQKIPNCTSVISRPLQDIRHSHLQSLNVNGKYKLCVCVFCNISQTLLSNSDI